MDKIRYVWEKINNQKGSIIILVATLTIWIFIVGFITDFCRILMLRRYFTIQFDHALKAASKQIDEEQLADRIIYIIPNKAEETFAEVFSKGVGLDNSYPYFIPGAKDRGYSGNPKVSEFVVINNVPASDPINNNITFDCPTVHGVIEIPMETCIWRYFAVNEIKIRIHCDATTEIIDS